MGALKLDEESIIVATAPNIPLITQQVLDTVLGVITPGTLRNAGVNWFVSPVVFDPELPLALEAASCECDFSFTGADAVIEFTNDGINFETLREGLDLKADAKYTIGPFSVESGNAFNIRANQNVTIKRCIVKIIGQKETS